MFWRKISRGQKKIFNVNAPAAITSQASYDPEEYSQNFDPGTGWQEPDNLPRSFSARYADPSRLLQRKQWETHIRGA
uniref:Uncharacterized protein n=1 Tax=Turnera subulata TaxID=218843 RepID=A0A516IJI9_9ROSI